ncbi:MAG: hypothetical protein RJA70_211, partial [Pseudomonadota bacterium]
MRASSLDSREQGGFNRTHFYAYVMRTAVVQERYKSVDHVLTVELHAS